MCLRSDIREFHTYNKEVNSVLIFLGTVLSDMIPFENYLFVLQIILIKVAFSNNVV